MEPEPDNGAVVLGVVWAYRHTTPRQRYRMNFLIGLNLLAILRCFWVIIVLSFLYHTLSPCTDLRHHSERNVQRSQ